MKDKKVYLSIYKAAHNNAENLLLDAKRLYGLGSYTRAYFFAFTALEEISKSQSAADVFTGLIEEDEFWKRFADHDKKIDGVVWATLDADESPFNIFSDTEEMIEVKEPKVKKRMESLYISVENRVKVSKPEDNIIESDAKEMIHAVEVALHQIFLMTEYYGHQIGTKGFMK